jgi:NADH-quinone oxidoreductase subunit F
VDLHLTKDRPTEAEKTAVDSQLGPPAAIWDGGALVGDAGARSDGHVAIAPKHGRDLLLPVLHAINDRVGWISHGAMNYVAVRMNIAPAEIYGVASFYAMFSLEPRPPVVAHVCDDIACLTRGAAKLCETLETILGQPGKAALGAGATWLRSPCLGLCDRAPAALISAAGETPGHRVIAPASPESIVNALKDAESAHLDMHAGSPEKPHIALAPNVQPRLLQRIANASGSTFENYLRGGGYKALGRAIEIGPEAIVREVIESRLLGRGGAAFPTGKKWEALLQQRKPGCVHYVVCNADESEPGTFKDRVLMEHDPFAILEGLTIAAFAVGAEKGFIYVRGEYPEAASTLAGAIAAARQRGYLGDAILGSAFRFDVELRRGAGAYTCGEETALFNSIEGYRGEPRNKPPFPTQSGLFRRPTIVNNVETLVNVPQIISMGGAEFARAGTAQSSGHRLFCISGHIQKPGVYELPFGVTLGELIQLAGGVGGTGRLKAVLLGGAAGTFVSPDELDIQLSFEGTRAKGATLGSGAVIVFDDSTNMKDILARIAKFFREESCGQCVPCRIGTARQEELLHRLSANRPLGSTAQEITLFQEIAQAMRDASICGLGQTASSAILSAIHRWGSCS